MLCFWSVVSFGLIGSGAPFAESVLLEQLLSDFLLRWVAFGVWIFSRIIPRFGVTGFVWCIMVGLHQIERGLECCSQSHTCCSWLSVPIDSFWFQFWRFVLVVYLLTPVAGWDLFSRIGLSGSETLLLVVHIYRAWIVFLWLLVIQVVGVYWFSAI